MTQDEEYEAAVKRERQWVIEEMEFSLSEIEALAEGVGIGASRDWLNYQRDLMAWPDATGYPEIHNRPFYITSG